jgi:hypothetical protein
MCIRTTTLCQQGGMLYVHFCAKPTSNCNVDPNLLSAPPSLLDISRLRRLMQPHAQQIQGANDGPPAEASVRINTQQAGGHPPRGPPIPPLRLNQVKSTSYKTAKAATSPLDDSSDSSDNEFKFPLASCNQHLLCCHGALRCHLDHH